MKTFVNDACVGCGLCAATCPDVFEMTNAGIAHAMVEEVSASEADGVQEAAANCPVNAIEVV